MKRTIIYALVLLLFACAFPSQAIDNIIFVGKWRLNLVEKNGDCVLIYSDGTTEGELDLAPIPPCKFASLRESNEIQLMDFENPTKQKVLIVFGTRYTGKLPASWPDVYCGTVSQAVLLRDDGVRLSNRVAEGGIRCSGKAIDALQFRMFNEYQ